MENKDKNPEDFIGKHEIRQDITIIPADESSKKMKLNWTVDIQENTTNNTYDYSGKAFETDEADKYRTHHGQRIFKEHKYHEVYVSWEILPELKGKPWNNLALSAVLMFNPSAIRVTDGCCTCDCWGNRVTVLTEKDGRTIKEITMELSPRGEGIKTGVDFKRKMEGRELPPPSDEPIIYINDYAVSKVDIPTKDGEAKPPERDT